MSKSSYSLVSKPVVRISDIVKSKPVSAILKVLPRSLRPKDPVLQKDILFSWYIELC
jgi:hypothetical protein